MFPLPCSKTRSIAAVIIALVLTQLCYPPSDLSAAKIQEGQEGIPFTGTNFINNEQVDLADHLKKKVILLDFGSIYCSSCMVTVPNLIKLSKQYSEDDLAIFNIYLDIYNSQRVVKFFLGFAKDLKFSLLIDQKLAISREYGVDTLPTTVIIDKSGIVRRVITGYTEEDEREITGIIDELVRELPGAGMAMPGGDAGISLFAPESFTKTTGDSVYIVGHVGGPGVKDVSVKLNNLPEQFSSTQDNIFHFKSNLSLAMNLIEVKGQVGEGKLKSESVVLFREPRMGMGIESELPEYKFHLDDEKKPCNECHQLKLSPQERESRKSTQLCLACHKDLTDQIYVHGPISVGGCLPCHDYASFPVKYELRTGGPNMCFTCHEDIMEAKEKSFIHGPIAAGVCTVCHDPHGTNERYLLRRKVDQQCLSCHQDTLKDYARDFVHTPVKNGQCEGCHDAHASDHKWLLKEEGGDLCALCHEPGSYLHTHKVGSRTTKEPEDGPEIPPLDNNGNTTCTTCHFVHASDYDKLAIGDKDGACSLICH